MRTFKQIKAGLPVSLEHEQWLQDMRELIVDSADEVMNRLNARIMGNEETARFLAGLPADLMSLILIAGGFSAFLRSVRSEFLRETS